MTKLGELNIEIKADSPRKIVRDLLADVIGDIDKALAGDPAHLRLVMTELRGSLKSIDDRLTPLTDDND